MSVTVDQILKLYVAGLLEGTGTSGDPIILKDLPANTVIGDLGGGTGAITLDQLKTALNLGGGNAGVRPLNTIVASGSDTIDLDQWAFDYWQIDLSNVSTETLTIIDPLTTAVPMIHLHFINMASPVTINFPANVLDANGDQVGSHVFEQGQIVPLYYANGNYYTNYLELVGEVEVQYDAAYQAILDRAGVQTYALPSIVTQDLQDELVTGLKSSGLWDLIDCLYVFTHDTALSDFSRLNWKDPSAFELTPVGSDFTWTAGGVTANTAGSYLDSGYRPLTDSGAMTSTSASAAVAVAGPLAGTGSFLGSWETGVLGLQMIDATADSTGGEEARARLLQDSANAASAAVVPVASIALGSVIQFSTSGVAKSAYSDGTKIGDEDITGDVANSPSSRSIFILSTNFTTPSNGSFGCVHQVAAWGAAMNETQAGIFNSLIKSYLAAV